MYPGRCQVLVSSAAQARQITLLRFMLGPFSLKLSMISPALRLRVIIQKF